MVDGDENTFWQDVREALARTAPDVSVTAMRSRMLEGREQGRAHYGDEGWRDRDLVRECREELRDAANYISWLAVLQPDARGVLLQAAAHVLTADHALHHELGNG